MSDATREPDWSRLPHDPAGFFGLGTGFDRRELKRSYNALLRRYKPEKFPQEFQRIRAAYEQLEASMRYGQATSSFGGTVELGDWQTEVERASGQGAKPADEDLEVIELRLHQRLTLENIGEVYR
jgi:hypothetical protein